MATRDLTQLRVVIAGCGGTGSAAAALLARMGVAYFALIDKDYVDTTNTNRLHYSKRTHAILRVPKVDVLGDAIAEIGLARSVLRLQHHVDAPECKDVLRSADIIIGCTDDHLGRNYLNRVSHFYLIPVIDLGVLIEPNDAGGYDAFDGRVTVVQPGYPCQICRQLIETKRMHEESLRRNDPDVFEQYRRAGYVTGGDDPSPVVVTFTTETATMAVNELLHRLTGYRGEEGHCAERVRRFDRVKDADCVPGGRRRPECPLCGRRRYDGRGDMTPFLDQI
jgi:molybdopterin/thiamine biosynthesis adenylyltransferase